MAPQGIEPLRHPPLCYPPPNLQSGEREGSQEGPPAHRPGPMACPVARLSPQYRGPRGRNRTAVILLPKQAPDQAGPHADGGLEWNRTTVT